MTETRTDDEILNDLPKEEEEIKEDTTEQLETKKEVKEDEEVDEEVDETKEEDKEDKEDKEEDKEDEDKQIYGVLSYKALNNYDPLLLKKFPTLRRAIQADAAVFSNFGSIEEMEEFAGRQENYAVFENSIISGEPELILKTLKQVNPEAFSRFVENFTPTINELSPDVFREKIAHPVISNFLKSAIDEGTKSGNENLILAAKHLARATYGTKDGSIPEVVSLKRDKKVDPEKVALEQKLKAHEDGKLNDFQDTVWVKAKEIFEAEIRKIINPRNELVPLIERAVMKEIEDEIGLELAQDQVYNSQINQLWRAAVRNNFRPEIKARVIQAFLARARPSLRKIASEKLKEAIPTSSRVKNDPSTRTNKIDGVPSKVNKVSSIPSSRVDYGNTTDEDIFSDRVALRK